MNKIGTKIADIHSQLLNILGDCLQFDLSSDQLKKIQDKKSQVMEKLFDLQNTIQAEYEKTNKNI